MKKNCLIPLNFPKLADNLVPFTDPFRRLKIILMLLFFDPLWVCITPSFLT